MSPYLTRNRTSRALRSKELQSKKNTSGLKAVPKIKRTVAKTSKLKDSTKTINTRSVTSSKITGSNENDGTNSQARNSVQNEEQKTTRTKKLSKKNIGDESKSATIPEQKLEDKKQKINKRVIKEDKKQKSSKRINKRLSNLRQMSLKESFLNQSRIRFLRSHTASAKARSDSRKGSPKNPGISKKKQPIYERLSPENSIESTNEVYEFKFDVNDSMERLPKKQKKRAAVKKALPKKNRKSISGKRNLRKVVRKKSPPPEKIQEDKKTDSVETLQNKNSVQPLIENEKNGLEKSLGGDSNKDMKLDTDLKNITNEQIVDSKITKPTVIAVDDVTNKTIKVIDPSQKSNSNDFMPFRPTNIFNKRLTVQEKNALNYSLFEKSLSPIVKSAENQQINSPWRASPLLAFSQVRNVFQSTPQNKKYDVTSKRFVRMLNNESKQRGTSAKAKNYLQENNENVSAAGRKISNTPKLKNTLTSRKFGTEITNTDKSLQFNSVEQIAERVQTDTERTEATNLSVNTVTSNVSNITKLDSYENKKQNGILSPQKSIKKERVKITVENQENVPSSSVDKKEDDYDPQPGPSGLQNSSVLNEQRVLRQSNLNNFLNIMDVPQSTTIKTPHGIFDDAESTAISSRSVKKLNDTNMELQNAFGFNDDDSNEEVPITEPKIVNENPERVLKPILGAQNIKKAARLSVGEIKNKLLVRKMRKVRENKENIHTEKVEVKKSPIKKKDKLLVDVSNFSDTFDVLSEAGDTSAVTVTDVPLFADYEPSHFTQPPRHSYKRKRAVQFHFSEEDSEEDDKPLNENEKKRKKIVKLKKEQEDRLKEWVSNINRTFNEVDEHELLIE